MQHLEHAWQLHVTTPLSSAGQCRLVTAVTGWSQHRSCSVHASKPLAGGQQHDNGAAAQTPVQAPRRHRVPCTDGPGSLPSSPAPAGRSKSAAHLTRALSLADSPSTLLQTLQRQPPSRLNGIHISAAYRRLVVLQGTSQPSHGAQVQTQGGSGTPLAKLLQLLSSLVPLHVQSMGAREAAGILWATASLRQPVGNPSLTALAERLLELKDSWTDVDVANTTWALSILLPLAPAAYSGAPCQHQDTAAGVTARAPTAPSAAPNGAAAWLPVLLGAVVDKLPHLPQRSLLVSMRSLSQPALSSMLSPQQAALMVSLLEGAAVTGTSRPSSTTAAAPQQQQQLQSPGLVAPARTLLAPRDLVAVLRGLARLGARPSPRWMQGAMDQVETQLQAFSGEDVAVLLCSLASLGYKPRPKLLSEMYSAALGPAAAATLPVAAGVASNSRQLQNTVEHSSQAHGGGDGILVDSSSCLASRSRAAAYGPGLVAVLLWSATRLIPPPVSPEEQQKEHQHAQDRTPLRVRPAAMHLAEERRRRGLFRGLAQPSSPASPSGMEVGRQRGSLDHPLATSDATPSSSQSSCVPAPPHSPSAVWASELLGRHWQRDFLPESWQLALVLYSLARLEVRMLDSQIKAALLRALGSLLRQQQGQPLGQQQAQQQSRQSGTTSVNPMQASTASDTAAGSQDPELASAAQPSTSGSGSLGSRELSSILWALPQLHPGLQLHRGLRTRLLSACQSRLSEFSSVGFAAALWGVARGVEQGAPLPSRDWVRRAAREAYRRLPSLGPRELPQVLWALAKLQFKPLAPQPATLNVSLAPAPAGVRTVAGPEAALQEGQQQQPQQLVPQHRLRPGANARRRLWRRTQTAAAAAQATATSNSLRPADHAFPKDWDRRWASAALSRIQRTAPGMDVRGLTAVLHACAWMELLPSKALLRVLMDLATVRSASMSPRCREGLRSVVSLLVARHAREDARQGVGAEAEGVLRLVCSSRSVAKARRSAGAMFGKTEARRQRQQQRRQRLEVPAGDAAVQMEAAATESTADKLVTEVGTVPASIDLLEQSDPIGPPALPAPLPRSTAAKSGPRMSRRGRQAWFEIDY